MSCKIISGGKELNKLIKKLGEKHPTLTAGFYEGSLYNDGTKIAQVGFWNEFGTEKGNIPPRPFLRMTVRNSKDKWKKLVKNKIIKNGFSLEKSADYVGNFMKSDIQKSITDLKTPTNAESTIKRKGSDNPLIDTGTMRTAVQYKVMK